MTTKKGRNTFKDILKVFMDLMFFRLNLKKTSVLKRSFFYVMGKSLIIPSFLIIGLFKKTYAIEHPINRTFEQQKSKLVSAIEVAKNKKDNDIKDSQLSKLFYQLGGLYFSYGKTDKAILAYEEALSTSSNKATQIEILLGLAQGHQSKGNSETAENYANKALIKVQNDKLNVQKGTNQTAVKVLGLYHLAQFYERVNKHEKAIKLALQAIKLISEDTDYQENNKGAHNMYGGLVSNTVRYYNHLKKHQEALELIDKSFKFIVKHPNQYTFSAQWATNPVMLLKLAKVKTYHFRGQRDEAEKIIDDFFSNKNLLNLRMRMGRRGFLEEKVIIMAKKGQVDEAIGLLKDAEKTLVL